ncbi:MAG: acyltransferase [Lachnospiraceae bacterium]|nr:acyltransferase [Lachnospiraceae bacterium]
MLDIRVLNSYDFLIKKLNRFWPLILVTSLICLLIGYFTMLPDDLENLGESVVSSAVFGNNILSAITTKNYWNLSNNYKPLMHLWYIGVLFQSFLLLPLAFSISNKVSRKVLKYSVMIMTFISLILYLLPFFSAGDKFYFFQFRAYEILIGCYIAFFDSKEIRISEKLATIYLFVITLLISLLLIVDISISGTIKVLIVTVLVALALLIIAHSKETKNAVLSAISGVGKASLSVYVVHQPIMAFTRYCFNAQLDGWIFGVDIILTAAISCLFYYLFEIKLTAYLNRHGEKKVFAISVGMCILSIVLGGIIYLRAGVVRNIPELDISVDNIHRGMHAEYVDIPYKWNREFSTDKIHILVVGDSMGRDWCNILNESNNASDYEISYVLGSQFDESCKQRVLDADYIFYASIGDSTENIPELLKHFTKQNNFYVVGIKNFGECNGQIYQHRFSDNYFKSAIWLGETNLDSGITFEEQNRKQKEYWGTHYIEMIRPIQNDDGSIPVFTDTHKFISSDTEHLTQNGCIFYSKILDLSFIK